MEDQKYMQMDDEISLFEILLILKKHIKFIVGCVVSIMVLSVLYILFLQAPSYEAQATIIASTQVKSYQPNSENEIASLVASQEFEAQYKIDSIMEQITLEPVLADVLNRLELDSKYGMTTDTLRKLISVRTKDNMSLINISVKYEDPVLARDLVNTTIDSFIAYYRDLNTKKIDTRIAFLSKEYENAKLVYSENLAKAQQLQLQEYPLEAIRADYERTKALIETYKSKLDTLTYDYQTAASNYDTVHGLFIETSPTLKLVKGGIYQDPVLHAKLVETYHIDESDLQDLAVEEEILNPLYEDLQLRHNSLLIDMKDLSAQMALTKETIARMEAENKELLEKLLVREKEFSEVQAAVESSLLNKLAYQENLNNAMIQRGADAAEQIITVASYAVLPTRDISNKPMILAVLLLLALLLSVVCVFVYESYQSFAAEQSSRPEGYQKRTKGFRKSLAIVPDENGEL